MNSQSKRSGILLPYSHGPDLYNGGIVSTLYRGSPTREVEKDNLVGLLHSFLIAAPRVIAINDPVSMVTKKLSHLFLHPIPVTVYPTRLKLKGVHMELGNGVVAG